MSVLFPVDQVLSHECEQEEDSLQITIYSFIINTEVCFMTFCLVCGCGGVTFSNKHCITEEPCGTNGLFFTFFFFLFFSWLHNSSSCDPAVSLSHCLDTISGIPSCTFFQIWHKYSLHSTELISVVRGHCDCNKCLVRTSYTHFNKMLH